MTTPVADITIESDVTPSVDLTSGADSASVSSGSNASTNGGDEFFFGKFCRHVPRVLRHQVISKLVNQYIYKLKQEDAADGATTRTVSKQGDPGVDFKANTSIYRFHGALLFVDISGFTVLSQKLKVDELKNQINAYFQKIVDIIYKYDGEIIKFAGDALFIIWQTKVSDTSKLTPLPCLNEIACTLEHIFVIHVCVYSISPYEFRLVYCVLTWRYIHRYRRPRIPGRGEGSRRQGRHLWRRDQRGVQQLRHQAAHRPV
jgi:hypothetical protein